MKYWVVALLAVALIGLAGRCQGAIFDTTVDGGIVMIGEIVEGDFAKFKAAAGGQEKTEVVILTGPGGNMIEALAIGEYVMSHKIKTIALRQCYSGCAYIWLAGFRTGMLPNSEIGFHAAFDTETLQANASANAVLGKYMSDCGASVNFIISALNGGREFRVFGPDKADFLEKSFGMYIFPLVSEADVNFFMEMRP